MTPHRLLPDDDLSETQIYETMATLDRFAKEYANKHEWNKTTVKEVKKYNIRPFLKYTKKNGTVLITASQAGRDYSFLTKAGLSCFCVGLSYGLLKEAVRRVPGGVFVRFDFRSLPFIPGSLDGIYADSLTQIPRRDLKNTLRDFRIFLRRGGVVYLSFKLGKKNVVETSDLGGKVYCTLYRQEEILKIIDQVGFKLLWSARSNNTDVVLPPWFSLIARKI